MKAWKKHRNNTICVEPKTQLSPREQALKKGILIDVSIIAEEAEIIYPVAMSAAAYKACGCSRESALSDNTKNRIWNVVYMLKLALKYDRGPSTTRFPVYIRMGTKIKKINFKAIILKDLLYTQVVTVMLPIEKYLY